MTRRQRIRRQKRATSRMIRNYGQPFYRRILRMGCEHASNWPKPWRGRFQRSRARLKRLRGMMMGWSV